MVTREGSVSRGVIMALALVATTTGCMGSMWWKTTPKVEDGRGSLEARKPSIAGHTQHGTTLVVSCQEDGVRIGFLSEHRMNDTRRHDGVTQARIQILPEDGKPWRDQWLERNSEGTGVWFGEDADTEAWLDKPYVGIKFRAPGYSKAIRTTFATEDLKKMVGEVRHNCEAPNGKVARR